jgi:catechol 2,3-dioxygenase-like lactoylglutathione lyase family enzyme
MDLGRFEISLDVADIDRSVAFYRALGFTVVNDSIERGTAGETPKQGSSV